MHAPVPPAQEIIEPAEKTSLGGFSVAVALAPHANPTF
jgi:hypothetical protein